MKKIIIIALFPIVLYSQPMDFEPSGIPVNYLWYQLPIPFFGGTTRASLAFADMNNDGDLDCYLGMSGGNVFYLVNIGDVNNPLFELSEIILDTFYTDHVCSPAVCDIDDDGDNDFFIADWDEWEAWYFDNYGGIQSPQFQFITDSLEGISYCSNLDFKDMDSDGDFDVITGSGGGGVEYYENIGNAQNYNFVFIDSVYSVYVVYGYSKPSLGDLDNDSDLDMVCGNYSGQINYLRNDGDPYQYNFTVVTQNLVTPPGPDTAPTLVDIDGDEDLDLFVGTGTAGIYTPFGGIRYYENTGSPEVYDFQLVTDNYFCIDCGWKSTLRLVDIDNDDDLDLFIGYGSGGIAFYRNIGTSSDPHFAFEAVNFQGLSYGNHCYPDFVDIDDDGDYDLFSGWGASLSGWVAYFENTGSPEAPEFQMINPYMFPFYDNLNIYPATCDIDGDGDYDMFIGSWEDLIYWENTGSASEPHFTWETNNYQNVGSGCPIFYDIDDDNDFDLFMGGGYSFKFFENIGNEYWADFQLVTESWEDITLRSSYSRPFFADIDTDDDADLFIGSIDGGVTFYRNQANPPPPLVSVLLTPQSASIQIPPGGGSFSFDVEIGSGDSLNYIIDASTDVTLPNSSAYPLILRPNINLQAGSSISREDLTQFVPANAPAGWYSYNALVLDNNTMQVLAVDSFAFEKLAGEGEALHDYGWELFGWDEPLPLSSIEYPSEVKLYQNVPNPFNPSTVIRFELRVASEVKLTVYDLTGREAVVLVDEYRQAGGYEITFDGTDLSSGMYFAKLEAGNITKSMKMLLLK